MTSSLPSRPERWLRSVLGDTATAASVIGDLREEFLIHQPGRWRAIRYTLACAAIALRYAPAVIADALVVETRQAWRGLRRAPTFTLASTATVALGVAVASTLLTVAYGSLIRPLPYPRAHELLGWGQSPLTGNGVGSINSAAAANVLDLNRSLTHLIGVGGFTYTSVTASAPSGAQRLLVAHVTGNFFDLLGARPLFGRTISTSDDHPGTEPTVVLAEQAWRRDFNGDRSIVGTLVTIDTVPHRVIGVMPRHLPWPGNPQAWMPFRWTPAQAAIRHRRNVEGIARLRPGVSIEQGLGELKSHFSALASAYPTENGRSTVAARPIGDIMRTSLGANSSILPLIAGISGLMLAIAYLNLGTLGIGRRESRGHEFAVRSALGASGWRQRVSAWLEAMMVAGVGGLGGTILTGWALPLVITRYGSGIPRAETIRFDLSTLAIAGGATTLAVIASAMSIRRSVSGLTGLNRRTVTGGSPVRRYLVAAQIGVAAGLAYGAVLVGAMIASMARVDLGVPIDRALTFSLGIPPARYDSPDRVQRFFADLERDINTIPGVAAVGSTSRTPFAGGTNGQVADADDVTRAVPITELRVVTRGFFDALQLPILRGAGFPVGAGDANAAVISESLSVALFGGVDAVGRRVQVEKDAPVTVVGVARDLRDFGPAQPQRPTLYLLHGSGPGFRSLAELRMIVRTTTTPHSVLPGIRDRLAALDRDVAVRAVATLEELAERSFGTNRTTASTVLTSFAAVAILLGMVGVFGVVAVSVERRTREIGLRLALGDSPRGVLNRVMREGLGMTAAGVLLGAGAAWLVHRLVKSFLIAAHQPSIAAAAAAVFALLVVCTLFACLLPARRAARLSPLDALREH